MTRPGDPLASRPFGSPTFTKLNADIQYVTPVKDRFFLRLDGSAQFSTKSLLIAEELLLADRGSAALTISTKRPETMASARWPSSTIVSAT